MKNETVGVSQLPPNQGISLKYKKKNTMCEETHTHTQTHHKERDFFFLKKKGE